MYHGVRGTLPHGSPSYYPEWGFAEPTLLRLFDGAGAGAHLVVWQKGNNKAIALDNIATGVGVRATNLCHVIQHVVEHHLMM